jgi:hypothetical protein
MTKEEETVQINKEIKDVLANHPKFALAAQPFIDFHGAIRAKPTLVYLDEEAKESVLEA